MTDLLLVISFFLVAQLGDYLFLISYSETLGYSYKYLPIKIRRQAALSALVLCFILFYYFGNHVNQLFIIIFSFIPITIYIYCLVSDLFKGKSDKEDLERDDI